MGIIHRARSAGVKLRSLDPLASFGIDRSRSAIEHCKSQPFNIKTGCGGREAAATFPVQSDGCLTDWQANSEPQDKMRAIPHRSSPLPSCSPCLPRCGAVRGLGAPVMAALYIAAVRWTDGRQNELGNGSPESKICTENTRHHQTSQQPSGVSQQRPKSQERMLLVSSDLWSQGREKPIELLLMIQEVQWEKGYCSSALTPEYVSRLCFFSFYKHPLWLHS
ncbi:uncharacterized protein LOC121678249 isoform X2 [Alosa sapidissima]|uniref:uncharacterized protein LOC121678249 isoform X2 n=1 Tax=Alosa sapidissima TaxID=34773 RepID=UPI001C092899|nr:uncharacterized protein LOC121678249 isoform X2 [Alosa sapidissima]